MSDDQQTDKLAAIEERLGYLEFAVREQIARLYAVEQRLGMIAPPMQQESAPASLPTPVPPRPPSASANLEEQIGGRWFNRIGVFAIVLAVGFFLKYAFDNEWIGPGMRVMMGLAGGVGMLLAGERFHRRGFGSYAQGISGGGIAILYLSIYAAFSFYQLIDTSLAFVCLTLVTATSVVLALRQDALALAVLGVLGGFLTPVLLGSGSEEPAPLFGYLILLNAGVLALAYFKGWAALSRIAFTATALLTAVWIADRYESGRFTATLLLITILFAVFAFTAVASNILGKRRAGLLDLGLIVSNAVFYYIVGYYLIDGRRPSLLGLFTLLLAALYFGLGELARRRAAGDLLLRLTAYGLAVLFLTIAIPVEFDRQWVTMLLGAESAALFWAGINRRNAWVRGAAFAVFGAALCHWVAIDVTEVGQALVERREFTFLLNRRVAGVAVLIGVLAFAASLYRRHAAEIGEEESRLIGTMCMMGAHLLVLFTLSLEAFSEFQVRIFAIDSETETGWAERRNLEFAQQMTLSLLWLVYGAGMLLYGIWRRNRAFRWAALGLLTVTIAKVFLVDLANLDRIYRIVSFFALGAMLLVISYLYQRALRRDGGSATG